MPQELLSLLLQTANNIVVALKFCLFVAVILSWLPQAGSNQIARFFINIAAPLLNFAKRLLPLRTGMIDFSPVFAFILLILAQAIIHALAGELGVSTVDWWGKRV